ncbi:hypothetical protein BHE90_012414 [Fusarium euwallaceae]|uniref:Uncharacterized protein n=1 Tax=Fusarium euwallaceae TaxID=1147111 RepID=A0A430LBP3_9HYPO|nr:hypothetical protein BHE90_012414 [Fusarium euwallaceae]
MAAHFCQHQHTRDTSRRALDHDLTLTMADEIDSQLAKIVKDNQIQLSPTLSTTPPGRYNPLLPSPPTTAERPAKGVDDDSDYGLPDALLQHKLWSLTNDVPEFAQLKLDQEQYHKLRTKIEHTFKRFDYEPRRSCLTVRMPSPTHDFFAMYFRDTVCAQLNKLVTNGTDETKEVAMKIESAMGSRVLLKEIDDENDEIKREPDILFKYPGTVYPGVVVEVSYSQDVKSLQRLSTSTLSRSSRPTPSAKINIQFSRLAQLAEDARQRQREQESNCSELGIKSRRITRKRRLSSSPVQQLRPEDEDRVAGQEHAVAQKYHQADGDYVVEDEIDEDYKPRAAKRRG